MTTVGENGDITTLAKGAEVKTYAPQVHTDSKFVDTLTPYMVLPLFATRFTDYAGGIRVSFIQPRLF